MVKNPGKLERWTCNSEQCAGQCRWFRVHDTRPEKTYVCQECTSFKTHQSRCT